MSRGFPEQYVQQVKDAQDIHNQIVTYKPKHSIAGKFPFDSSAYLEKFDFDNLPQHLVYKDSFSKTTGQKTFINIIVEDLNDELSEAVDDFCVNDMKFTFYEAHLLYFGTGSVTNLHRDVHIGIRHRNNIFHLIDEDKMYEQFRKFWIPLQDRKTGHFFEVNGIPIVDWKANDLIEFQSCYPHCGANCGPDPRIALLITGTDV